MPLTSHQSQSRPDWQLIDADRRNIWQRIAASTGGFVTPGNIISLAGAIMVMLGLMQFSEPMHVPLLGLALIIIGRLADVLDGYIANLTGTKSPLGEAVDATLDKIIIVLVLIYMAHYQLLPLSILVVITFHAICNSVISIAAQKNHVNIHPLPMGKITAVLSWIILTIYPFSYLIDPNKTSLITVIHFICYVIFIIFVLLGAQSTLQYYRQLRSKQTR